VAGSNTQTNVVAPVDPTVPWNDFGFSKSVFEEPSAPSSGRMPRGVFCGIFLHTMKRPAAARSEMTIRRTIMGRRFPIIICSTLLMYATVYPQEKTIEAKHQVPSYRKVSLTLEAGWNSLVGAGPNIHYYLNRQVSIDAGVGMGAAGWKLGTRTRYLFSPATISPYTGVGIVHKTGTTAPPMFEDTVRAVISPSSYLQVSGGIDCLFKRRFVFMGALGYSFLLGGDNVETDRAELSAKSERVIDLLFGAGPIVAINIGYALRTR
jgi:hypothetical protein